MSKASQLVHARYLGDTPQVMPDLVGRDRCCKEENQRENDSASKPNPHAVISPGDVILLDRFSAEGRSDFEIVDKPKSKSKAPSEGSAPAPKKE